MFSQGLVGSMEQVRSARAGNELEGREEEMGTSAERERVAVERKKRERF